MKQKYYLSAEEAAVIDDLRYEKKRSKQEAKSADLPRCTECDRRPGYSPPAKKDGLCGVHWNMRHAKKCGASDGEWGCNLVVLSGEYCYLHKKYSLHKKTPHNLD